MKISILQGIEGAKAARGLTVIIDVFRAFSLEAYLFSMGAERILPIGDAELAYSLKRKNPDYLLAGERDGKIMPGFDTGNSPSQIGDLNIAGRTVVHTTSAGTQGIANATHADEILGASLLTAKATAEYIMRSKSEEVSLVCMGLSGVLETEEDTLCARYIKAVIEGDTIDFEKEIEILKRTSGAKFFDPQQNEVFPQKDFEMCTLVDKFDFVLKLEQNADIPYMVKI